MIKDNYIIKSILGLITFSTIIPVRVSVSIEEFARFTWFWPFIHVFIGIFAYGIALICSDIFNLSPIFAGAITYGFLLVFTGYHHTDGLMDMADGVMVHGSPERKIEVMKDSVTGAGGIISFFLVAFITILSISFLIDHNLFLAIIVGEMCSKISLLSTCLSSKSLSYGSGYPFIKNTNKINFTIAIVLLSLISFNLCHYAGLIAIIGAIFGGSIISLIARKNFGVANGDVLGASNEFGRMMSLLSMVIFVGVFL